MVSTPQELARHMFQRKFDAVVHPAYAKWRSITAPDGRLVAVLGLRAAATERLFLECYLPAPIEKVVGDRLGMPVRREEIVEIGCLAAVNGRAMLQLWRSCAESLAATHRIAVATPTRTLRSMLSRAGVPMVELGFADRAALEPSPEDWGRYYDERPVVCAGVIDAGLSGLSTSLVGAASR